MNKQIKNQENRIKDIETKNINILNITLYIST